MKKKFLCIVLALIILPTIFMFSACAGSGYKLSSLKNDYVKMFDYKTIKLEEEQFKIDYSTYAYFNGEVLSNAPYCYLNNYNAALTNIMSFSDSYLNQISKGEYQVSASVRNQLKQDLNELDIALTKLDVSVQNCAEYIEFSKTPNEPHCLNRLESVYNSYEEVYQSAFNFNSTLMEIYFANAKVKDYTTEQEFTPLLAVVDIRLEARIKQQIVYTTAGFTENYVCKDFSNLIIHDVANAQAFVNAYNLYANEISNINKALDEQKIEAVSNNAETLANFKSNVIKLNNIQMVMNNDFKYFKTACNTINFVDVKNNIAASNNEKTQATHISNFGYLVVEYNGVLTNLISIIGA